MLVPVTREMERSDEPSTIWRTVVCFAVLSLFMVIMTQASTVLRQRFRA